MATKKRKTVREYYKVCVYCGNPFVSSRKHAKTCSVACRSGVSHLKKEIRESLRKLDNITEDEISEFIDELDIRAYIEGLLDEPNTKTKLRMKRLNALIDADNDKFSDMTNEEVIQYLDAKD